MDDLSRSVWPTLTALAFFTLTGAIVVASVHPAAKACPLHAIPWWAWFAALLPGVIVTQHAFGLFLVRSSQLLDERARGVRELFLPPPRPALSNVEVSAAAAAAQSAAAPRVGRNASDTPSGIMRMALADADLMQTYLPSVRSSVDREFAPIGLFIRYGVPTLLIVLVIVTWIECLGPNGPLARTTAAEAAWMGLAGAYSYTLLQLGRRAFLRDITTGVATWCAITLMLGPLLAALLTRLGIESFTQRTAGESTALVSEVVEPPGDSSDASSPASPAMPTAAATSGGDAERSRPGPAIPEPNPSGLLLSLFFVAGFAPRYVVESIFERVRSKSSYLSSSNSVVRGMPLTDVRGIVPEIAERLTEEGIEDVAGLSLADPVRLLRNTAFDKRQVLGWIDEAILISTLPDHWQAIEKQGITGAIDLAWYTDGGSATPAPADSSSMQLDPIVRLAKAINVEPEMLRDVSTRLRQDAQVCIVWTIYQAGGTAETRAR